jgi:hypothetical protein
MLNDYGFDPFWTWKIGGYALPSMPKVSFNLTTVLDENGKITKSYISLNPEDVLKDGDEYYCKGNGGWKPVSTVGKKVKDQISCFYTPSVAPHLYRRPIPVTNETKPEKKQYRTLEEYEIVQKGDQVSGTGDDGWADCNKTIGNTASGHYGFTYRRPVRIQSNGWRYLDIGEKIKEDDQYAPYMNTPYVVSVGDYIAGKKAKYFDLYIRKYPEGGSVTLDPSSNTEVEKLQETIATLKDQLANSMAEVNELKNEISMLNNTDGFARADHTHPTPWSDINTSPELKDEVAAKKTEKEPEPEYYYLKRGEVVKEGDECAAYNSEKWLPTIYASKRVGEPYMADRYRRKLPKGQLPEYIMFSPNCGEVIQEGDEYFQVDGRPGRDGWHRSGMWDLKMGDPGARDLTYRRRIK